MYLIDAISQLLEEEHPEKVISDFTKNNRKVY